MGLLGHAATAIVAKAQGLFAKLTASAVLFPSPVPPLATFQTHIDELAAANAAADVNGGKAEYQEKRETLKVVLGDIKSLAAYVQATSFGDKDMILASGFDVVRRGSLIGELAPPDKLVARFTNMEGRASLAWDGEDGTDMYHVFISRTAEPFKWELIGATTKRRFNADSLEPATAYWFAVSAIGAAGESSKSEPLMARAA